MAQAGNMTIGIAGFVWRKKNNRFSCNLGLLHATTATEKKKELTKFPGPLSFLSVLALQKTGNLEAISLMTS